jgi:hypothetical protein
MIFANIPGEQNSNIPFFIITDMEPALAVRPPFQPPFPKILPPTRTNPGNTYGAPPPTTPDFDANLNSPSMVLSSQSASHFRATSRVSDNNLEQNSLGVTTHAPLNCNMPRQSQRASSCRSFVSRVLTIHSGPGL